MTKSLGLVGLHLKVEDLESKDINGLPMFRCNVCKTYTRNKDHFIGVVCNPNCKNCEALRSSYDGAPAVPHGGTCNMILHTCTNDGNRWWQYNSHFHLWKHVTAPTEWRSLEQQRDVPLDENYLDGWYS